MDSDGEPVVRLEKKKLDRGVIVKQVEFSNCELRWCDATRREPRPERRNLSESPSPSKKGSREKA